VVEVGEDVADVGVDAVLKRGGGAEVRLALVAGADKKILIAVGLQGAERGDGDAVMRCCVSARETPDCFVSATRLVSSSMQLRCSMFVLSIFNYSLTYRRAREISFGHRWSDLYSGAEAR
jgi:hypothetical protein